LRPSLWRIVVLTAVMVSAAGCGKSEDKEAAETAGGQKQRDDSGGGYIDQMRQVHHRAKEMARVEPARDCIRAFQAVHGRYPKDLDELKKEYPELPDPPQGMRYNYRPATGEVDVVSADK